MPTPSRTVRVFLSSTFRDFAEERDLLVRKVFPELRRKCRERQVELVDVDLRWGITEEEAQQGKVLPICLAEIDRSRPYFIGFLGERYGSIPDVDQYDLSLLMEQPWLDEHRGGKSITELEILHGVLNNPDMAGQAFFYFRDPEYSYSKGGDYLSESPEDQVKLDLLKHRIRESGFPVVENYPDPEVLAKRVMDDLWQLIESAYPENKVPDQLDLMKRRHETYSASRQGLYIGGEEYLATLDQIMGSTMHKPVMVTGDSGGGKSTLLANWARSFSHQNPDAFVLEHYLATGADNAEATTMVTRLLREIARFTGEDLLLEGDPRKALYLLHEWLSKAGAFARQQGGRFILVLDGLDKMTGGGGLDWFPRHLPEGVGLVASCLPGLVYDAIATRMAFEQVIVTPFSRTDCEVFIHRYLEKFRKPLPQELVELTLQHPHCGNPLFLRTLLEEMRIFGVHEQLRQKLEHYLESITIDDLFEKVLERVEADNRPADVKAVLEVLWAAKESFAEDELLDISGVPPAVWAAIHIALDDSLIGDIGRVLFCHDYMRKAVEDRYLATEEDRARIRICMAEFCAHAMQSNRKDISNYIRRHAVEHFLEVEDWDNAAAALSDIEYIEARARAQELSSMLIDYSAALHLLPEGESERQAEDARQAELDRYAREMHDYAATWTRIREGSSEAQPTLPRPVESVRFWSEEEIAAERKRITETPNRLEIVKAFRFFVATNTAPLQQYSTQEGFAANHARNDAPAGPVHDEGKRRLAHLKCIKIIKQFAQDEIYNPLPASQAILEGHTKPARCNFDGEEWQEAIKCSLSICGIIVSGNEDGTLRVWNSSTHQCIKVIVVNDRITAVDISADGRLIVAAGGNNTLSVWDAGSGLCLQTIVGHAACVYSLALSADGRLAVSGSWDKTLRVWDVKSGHCLQTLEGHADRITSLALSADGRLAVSGSWDKTLRVWDVKSGQCLKTIEGHAACVYSLALSVDGRIAVSGSTDGTLRVWDVNSGQCLQTLEGHTVCVDSLALSADSRIAVSGSEDGTLRVWNLQSGRCQKVLKEHMGFHSSLILRLSADGRTAVTGSVDNVLKVWDINGTCSNRKSLGKQITAIDFSCLSNRVVTGGADKFISTWMLKANNCQLSYCAEQGVIRSVFIDDNHGRIISTGWDNNIKIWNIDTGSFIHSITHSPESKIVCEALSNDSNWLVLGISNESIDCYDDVIEIWNTKTGKVETELNYWMKMFEEGGVSAVAIDEESKYIAAASHDENVIRLWDWQKKTSEFSGDYPDHTGQFMYSLDGHNDPISRLFISNKLNKLISGDHKGNVKIWDFKKNSCISDILAHEDEVILVTIFNEDFFATASRDDTLKLWNLTTKTVCGMIHLRNSSCFMIDWNNHSAIIGTNSGIWHYYKIIK